MAGRVGCRTGVYQQNGRVGLQWATSVGVFVLNLGPDLECPVKRSWLPVAVLALLRNNPWNYY